MKSREHERVLHSADAIKPAAGSVNRITRDMNAVTLPVVFIFLIAEIPIVALSYSSLSLFALPEGYMRYSFCEENLIRILNRLVLTTCMVSSSYVAFCFLMSVHYRETLRILRRERCDCVRRIFRPCSYEKVQTVEMVDL